MTPPRVGGVYRSAWLGHTAEVLHMGEVRQTCGAWCPAVIYLAGGVVRCVRLVDWQRCRFEEVA